MSRGREQRFDIGQTTAWNLVVAFISVPAYLHLQYAAMQTDLKPFCIADLEAERSAGAEVNVTGFDDAITVPRVLRLEKLQGGSVRISIPHRETHVHDA